MSTSTALRGETQMKAFGSHVRPASNSAAVARFLPDLFKTISKGLHRWRRHRAERRAIARLERMSDRTLADMGLGRSEIQGAVRYGRALSASPACISTSRS